MKLQIKINKKPFSQLNIVGLLKACDKSLSLKQAKNMVEEEIKHKVADVDDVLEFDLPNGSLVNVNFSDYNPDGVFDINAAQGDEIPEELDLTKTPTTTLKIGTLVLVRDTPNEKWKLGMFSHFNNNESDAFKYPYIVLGDEMYAKCIPLKGNEHLINTTYSEDSLPVPKEPTYDDEKKRYRVVFGNQVTDYTDQGLYNFITNGVLRNRDIGLFTVIDTERPQLS